ncbi:MAG: tetratricopeptide repeat protein [Candidatus Solibacter usitatus]|nr:tetratricopeptide repeat protein [Candidatus Solibacter usitatus]
MRSWLSSVAVAAIALAVCPTPLAMCQTSGGGGQRGGGGAGGGGTPAPTAPTAPATPSTPNIRSTTPGTPSTAPNMMEFQQPMNLSGRVMMDDGTAPPEPVVLFLVCNGQPRPQGYTDMKGRFNISLGQNQTVMADASMSSINDGTGGFGSGGRGSGVPGSRMGVSERDLMGCEFKADLPGYRSDIVQLSGRRVMDNPEVGTIVLHRMANVQGFTYSLTSSSAPKDARKAYEKGMELNKKKKYADAEPQLRKAVEAYPKYALAWYELGKNLDAQKKPAEARKAYEESVSADAKFVNPHLELLQQAVTSRDWNQIAERSDAVLKLNPFNYPNVWFMNGAAYYNLKKLDVAEKSAREAVKLDAQHRNPGASQLLGYILADKGDYPGALEQMKGYLSFAPLAPDVDSIRKQVAELERITGAKATAQKAEPARQ